MWKRREGIVTRHSSLLPSNSSPPRPLPPPSSPPPQPSLTPCTLLQWLPYPRSDVKVAASLRLLNSPPLQPSPRPLQPLPPPSSPPLQPSPRPSGGRQKWNSRQLGLLFSWAVFLEMECDGMNRVGGTFLLTSTTLH